MITSKHIIRQLSKILNEDSSFKVLSEIAREVGDELGIDWNKIDFNQFYQGIQVEYEHGDTNSQTDVMPEPDDSKASAIIAGKIALAHLNELPDYYTRLAKMEND